VGSGQGEASEERAVSLPLVINPEAEVDLAEAKVWYSSSMTNGVTSVD
jgi:hypothetical protein